jgi:crotonobetainyl-CoA:carnitine CoA-transferase CaiB-like acyl-CoA transferase
VLAGLLAGAWGRPAALAAAVAAAIAAAVAAAIAAAAAAAAVPLAALLPASEVADPLARGSPAHVNGYLVIPQYRQTIRIFGFFPQRIRKIETKTKQN